MKPFAISESHLTQFLKIHGKISIKKYVRTFGESSNRDSALRVSMNSVLRASDSITNSLGENNRSNSRSEGKKLKIGGRGGWCNRCFSEKINWHFDQSRTNRLTSSRHNIATRHDRSDWTDSKEFERTQLQVWDFGRGDKPALKLSQVALV